MGLLVDGEWRDDSFDPGRMDGGRSVRPTASSATGSPPTVRPALRAKAASGGSRPLSPLRFLACPWAHRTLIFRALKGLESMISLSVVNWHMGERGWTFAPARASSRIRSITRRHFPTSICRRSEFSGRVTVPVLWDRQRGTIVNNESAEIIRMLNSAFDLIGAKPGDYYPLDLRAEIDALNERIYWTSTTASTGRFRHHAGGL